MTLEVLIIDKVYEIPNRIDILANIWVFSMDDTRQVSLCIRVGLLE